MSGNQKLAILAACICLASVLLPGAALAQPGRTFTPPPPPPPPPPQPPRIFTPPTMPNIQQIQNMSAQRFNDFQLSNQRDMIKTRQDGEAIRRAANPSNPVRNSTNAAQGFWGVVVTRIEPNTQCDNLGVQEGVVLVSYSGTPLRTTQQVQTLVRTHAQDVQNIELIVLRGSELKHFNVDPGRLGVIMRVQWIVPR